MVLPRQRVKVATTWGDIAGIVAILPGGTRRFSPEYAWCREIADKKSIPLADVDAAARRAFEKQMQDEDGQNGH